MKVRDFAAELISEIADELGYLVYKYECSSPSCGNIVFEKEVSDEDDEAPSKKYKILDYAEHEVHLTRLLGEQRTINLHEPESVDEIREWFEDLEDAFDSPQMLFNGFLQFPTIPVQPHHQVSPHSHQIYPTQPTPPYTITTTPHTNPYHVGTGTGVGWNPSTTVWVSNDTQPCNQLAISSQNDDLFSFNSFGSLSLGP